MAAGPSWLPAGDILDLWAHTVQPPGSQSRLEIEGREETVHSNVQILWGKIARAERS